MAAKNRSGSSSAQTVNVAAVVAKSTTSTPTTAQPIVGDSIDDMGRDLSPQSRPLIGQMFVPRILDRRSRIKPPWTADQIIAALAAAEWGDMGPQADLSEAMADRDAAYLGFRQTRILTPAKLPWSIEPADDSPLAKEIADFVRMEIKRIPNFPHAHRDMFSATGSGISALWIDWQEGGHRHGGKAPKSKYRIDGIHFINPKRYRFHWMEERFLILPDWAFGKIQEIAAGPMQFANLATAGYGVVPPPWKCLIHRSRIKSGHPAKAGIDRVCALHFYLRLNTLKDAAAYCEIYGMPWRVAKYPPGTLDEEKAYLAQQIEQLGTDAAAIVSSAVDIQMIESRSRTGGGLPFFDLLKESERQMQLAWIGQDQTNTHNPTGGRTQVKEGGAPIRQDLVEADCIDAQATYTMQLVKAIVGFSDYGWDLAATLCPQFKIHFEVEADFEGMAKVDAILLGQLRLKQTQGQLAKRYNRELPEGVDPAEVIDFTPAMPPLGAAFGVGDAPAMPDAPPIGNPAKNPKPKALPPAKKLATVNLNFAAETADSGTVEHSYASTQVNITGAVASQVLELAAGIPDDALAEKGREDTPHVTVKFGLDPAVTVDELRPIIGPRAAGSLTLGPTAFFAAPDYDVVFLTVDSPDLVALNKAITDAVKTTQTQPNYVPHCTLAYVESGRGHEFAGNGAMNGVKFAFTSVYYSDVDGNLTKIQAIKGHVRVTKPKMAGEVEECAVCTHGLDLHALLTSEGLTICSGCPGSDQCHTTGGEHASADLAAAITRGYKRGKAVTMAELNMASTSTGQSAIDDLQQEVEDRAATIFQSLVTEAKEVCLKAKTLEEIPDLLRAAFPDLDAVPLQRLTARTVFVARLNGRASAKRTKPASI